MCILYACQTGIPSLDRLRDGHEGNPHGGGIAWIGKRGMVEWRKGIAKPKELYRLAKSLPLPLLIHQRLASAGGVDPALTHPFPVSHRAGTALRGRSKMVVAHNGHIGQWQRVFSAVDEAVGGLPPGPWSDSRLLAYLMAYAPVEKLSDFTKWQRIATLSDGGIKVYNPGQWALRPKETDGYWQSSRALPRSILRTIRSTSDRVSRVSVTCDIGDDTFCESTLEQVPDEWWKDRYVSERRRGKDGRVYRVLREARPC